MSPPSHHFLSSALLHAPSITRPDLGPHKTVCIVIPTIFLVTSFVVDYVLFAQAGLKAFDYKTAYASSVPPDGYDPDTYDPSTDPLATVQPVTGFVFVFCSLANFLSFFMSWFYMYDTARAEWQSLQNAGAEGAQGALPPSLSYPSDVVPSGADSRGLGHAAVPTNSALLEEGDNASHLYGDVVGEDLDAPKTVQDRVADRDKVRLMKHFFIAVSMYLILAVLVFFLPLFVPMAVDAALLMVYDAILFAFLTGLLVVFRMRDTNQFLLLGEDGEGAPETTTELGVLYRDDEEQGGGFVSRGGGGGSSRYPSVPVTGVVVGAPTASANVQQPPLPPPQQQQQQQQAKYTLGDDDEDDDGYRDRDEDPYEEIEAAVPPPRQQQQHQQHSASSASINSHAASQGVVVQPLPSPAQN